MIITRSPLRISLGGGGTDLPSYYEEHGGFVVSAAIDRFVYITIHQTFVDEMIVKYSRLERVRHAKELQHPIVREALDLVGVEETNIEITSMADIPAGTGLGSSGSFTTALLRALHAHKRNLVRPEDLAREACEIEIDRLGEPVGKQDQYIAAFGGVTAMTFEPDGSVNVEPVRMSAETASNLEDNLLLFFTGYTRAASEVLRDQDQRTRTGSTDMLDELHRVKASGYEVRSALENGDLDRFAELMRDHWERKRERSASISSPAIDESCALGLRNGARAVKLVGAGGGGFLLFYADDRVALRRAMADAKLPEVRFAFDFDGTRILIQ